MYDDGYETNVMDWLHKMVWYHNLNYAYDTDVIDVKHHAQLTEGHPQVYDEHDDDA